MDKNGMHIVTANDSPLLDKRSYEVGHIDGTKQALAANIIAEKTTFAVRFHYRSSKVMYLEP